MSLLNFVANQVMLINVELAQITPPSGVLLYVVRGIVPGTTMAEINRAVVPIIFCHLLVMGLIIAFPSLATRLPALMTAKKGVN